MVSQEDRQVSLEGAQMNRQVRTAVITGPSQVEVLDRPLRVPGPEDLLVRTLYSGISAGTEMNVYRGRAPQWRTRRDPITGLFLASGEAEWTYPLVYGYAAVGRVEEVGELVSAVGGPSVGDLVFTYTPHAAWSVVRAADAIVLRPLEDGRVGVLFANLNTALTGVLDAQASFGDVVVVSGLGVIGLCVLQLLRRSGVSLLVGVDAIEHRRQAATGLGADVVYSPADNVAEEVRALSDNRGADIVIEVSGASAALNEAIRTVGYNGTVIAMSWYGGSFESLSLSGEFHHNRPRIISSQVGGINPALSPLWSVNRRKELASSLLDQLELKSLLTHTVPIEQAPEAYALVDKGADSLVQCVLSYEGAW